MKITVWDILVLIAEMYGEAKYQCGDCRGRGDVETAISYGHKTQILWDVVNAIADTAKEMED